MESSYWLRSQKTESQHAGLQCSHNTSKKMKIMESTAEGSLDTNPFDSLSTKILQKILSHLPVHDRVCVERVCKRWKNVSTERVWRDVQVLHLVSSERKEKYHRFRNSLRKFGKVIMLENNKLYITADEPRMIQSLLSRAGQYVKRIIFHPDTMCIPTRSVVSIITTYCHNIEVLHLLYVANSDVDVWSRLLEVNKQLHSFVCAFERNIFEILPLRDFELLDINCHAIIAKDKTKWKNGMIALIENSPSLEEFYVYHWTMDLLAAISGCKHLKTLIFRNEIVQPIRHMVDTSLLNRLTCLEVQFPDSMDNEIINLLRDCMNLETLGLFYLRGKLPQEAEQVVLALPKLVSLALDARSITDEMLSYQLKFKHLRIKGDSNSITDNAIFEMIKNSEFLEKLEISYLSNVTSKLFERLAQIAAERCQILEIEVSTRIYEDALNVCKGSKIHIIEDRALSW